MKTISKGKSSTAAVAGQQAEMSHDEKMRRLASVVEFLEPIIERAIRARFGIAG